MKNEHKGLTFNEILYIENIDKEYSSFINQNKINEAVEILVKIGFDYNEAQAQVKENIDNNSSVLNFFKAIFHSLTNYKFQK